MVSSFCGLLYKNPEQCELAISYLKREGRELRFPKFSEAQYNLALKYIKEQKMKVKRNYETAVDKTEMVNFLYYGGEDE